MLFVQEGAMDARLYIVSLLRTIKILLHEEEQEKKIKCSLRDVQSEPVLSTRRSWQLERRWRGVPQSLWGTIRGLARLRKYLWGTVRIATREESPWGQLRRLDLGVRSAVAARQRWRTVCQSFRVQNRCSTIKGRLLSIFVAPKTLRN